MAYVRGSDGESRARASAFTTRRRGSAYGHHYEFALSAVWPLLAFVRQPPPGTSASLVYKTLRPSTGLGAGKFIDRSNGLSYRTWLRTIIRWFSSLLLQLIWHRIRNRVFWLGLLYLLLTFATCCRGDRATTVATT